MPAQANSGPTETPPVQLRQRVLLVTGVLGAGKTTALRVLEDLGWEVIDNFPIRMLERLIDAPDPDEAEHAPLAIGFDSRTRGFNPHSIMELVERLSCIWIARARNCSASTTRRADATRWRRTCPPLQASPPSAR